MRTRIILVTVAVTVMIAIGMAGSVAKAAASHSTGKHVPVCSLLSDRSHMPVGNGNYIVRNNVYKGYTRQCLTVNSSGGFTISRFSTQSGRIVDAYPDKYTGCDMWDICTEYSALPVPVNRLSAVDVTVSTRFSANPAMVANDASDDWFTSGPLNGPVSSRAEFMLWLDWRGIGTRTNTYLYFCHQRWAAEWWTAGPGGINGRWQYIQLREISRNHSLKGCNIEPAIRYFETHNKSDHAVRIGYGMIRPHWKLSSLDWGFECWQECQGNTLNSYSVTVTRKSPIPVIRISPPHQIGSKS
jgi:hypothetical protein